MAGPMFDLEDCEGAILKNNKTTSERFVKARNCPQIYFEGNEAGLSELGKLGIPVEALNNDQINAIASEVVERKGVFSESDNDWLTNTATFATLAADVKSTIIGVLVATGISCYKTFKEKLIR